MATLVHLQASPRRQSMMMMMMTMMMYVQCMLLCRMCSISCTYHVSAFNNHVHASYHNNMHASYTIMEVINTSQQHSTIPTHHHSNTPPYPHTTTTHNPSQHHSPTQDEDLPELVENYSGDELDPGAIIAGGRRARRGRAQFASDPGVRQYTSTAAKDSDEDSW